jgi:hypothetical protein
MVLALMNRKDELQNVTPIRNYFGGVNLMETKGEKVLGSLISCGQSLEFSFFFSY